MVQSTLHNAGSYSTNLVGMVEWSDHMGGSLQRLHGPVVIMNLSDVSFGVSADDGPEGRVSLS